MPVDENGTPVDWSCDPNEPRYCLCNQISYGSMVACDNEEVIIYTDLPFQSIVLNVTIFFLQCQFEWFHYGCVGITQPPKGKWYCPPCTNQMKRKNRKEKV